MRIVAAILAAGSGTRFGSDKTRMLLGDKPVWRWSFDAFANHSQVDEVILVGSPDNIEELSRAGRAVLGGNTRQESSRLALEASEADILLVHDGARPFVSADVISRVIESVIRVGAAAPAVPVADTLRRESASGYEPVDRQGLLGMQTPQGATSNLLRRGHESAVAKTDEIALIEAIGCAYEIVKGDSTNFKITTREDFERAQNMISTETRTGIGFDIHRFSIDPHRKCFLGGVAFPDAPGLEGHSDADVLLHAMTDALLGAASLGDIGVHFPNTEAEWKDRASIDFLAAARRLVEAEGWRIVNLDATVIAELPKVMKQAEKIREIVAGSLGCDPKCISVKATTNEGLGSIGRGEGVSAFAIATICR